MRRCAFDGCSGKATSLGWCYMHYSRSKRGTSMDRPKEMQGDARPYRHRIFKSFDELAERAIPITEVGCLIWCGAKIVTGYGKARHDGRDYLAHRLSYELARGEIPEGLCVLHRCDTPLCINPDHLFLGTRTDNSADKVAKGRQKNGPFWRKAK